MSSVSEVPDQPRSRLWQGGLLVLLWIAIQSTAWAIASDFTTQVMFVYYISPAMAFVTLLWFLFFSRVAVLLRLAVLVGLIASVAAFFGAFRHTGYSGAMVPQFALRWGETAEERALEYFAALDQQQAPRAPVTQTSEDERPQLEAAADDWPQFRGPRRDGICTDCEIRRDWNERPPEEIWRHPVGVGWSSFSLVGDYAFTQEQRGDFEVVVCYAAETGKQNWVHKDLSRFTSQMGGDGPRATPTFYQSRIYALGATGILNCLDALTGEVYWTRNILSDAQAENLGWGMAAAPLVYDDRVIVNPGGTAGRAVIAYDRLSGEELWANGDFEASYCAVRKEKVAGQEQLLIFDADGIAGLQPDGGAQIWRKQWLNTPKINVAQPIIHDGSVFFSSGYGSGSALLDVSQLDDAGVPRSVWETPNKFKLKFNDGVYRDGHVFGLDDGILSCVNASTGKRLWKRGRYRHGQLLLVQDLILVQGEAGEVALVEANPEVYRELGRFQALDGVTWNHPVVHRGRLYVRNGAEAACFDISK